MTVPGADLPARTARPQDASDDEHGKEDTMTLVKRMQQELDWPTWMNRRFLDMAPLCQA